LKIKIRVVATAYSLIFSSVVSF